MNTVATTSRPGHLPRPVATPSPQVSPGPILVVDSDPAVARMLGLVLGAAGWETVHAPDGESAIEHVNTTRPTLVLADVRLPDIESADFVRRIRESDAPGTCVVLMSAYPRPPWAMEDDFLSKPLQFDRLFRLLEELREAS